MGTFIFALGFTTTSYQINEIGSTLSFYNILPTLEPGRAKRTEMLRPAFRKFFLPTAAFSVFLTLSVSCKEDSIEVNNGTGGHITISPLLTRVTETAFENGDRIGLTILIGEERFSENSPMEYSNGIFSGNITWYEDTGTGSEFYAYHPYDEDGIPTSFSVSSDQSEGTSASDLVIGTKSDVKPSAESVKMTFRHVLSKITVKMTNSTGADIESLSFEGARNTGNVDIFTSEGGRHKGIRIREESILYGHIHSAGSDIDPVSSNVRLEGICYKTRTYDHAAGETVRGDCTAV